MSEVTKRRLTFTPARELYDLDLWIRQSLRDTHSPERTLETMADYLALNAVEMGFIQHTDGSWRWAGEWTWGPGVVVSVEAVPYADGEA
mgnify:CR=1 FL=1